MVQGLGFLQQPGTAMDEKPSLVHVAERSLAYLVAKLVDLLEPAPGWANHAALGLHILRAFRPQGFGFRVSVTVIKLLFPETL